MSARNITVLPGRPPVIVAITPVLPSPVFGVRPSAFRRSITMPDVRTSSKAVSGCMCRSRRVAISSSRSTACVRVGADMTGSGGGEGARRTRAGKRIRADRLAQGAAESGRAPSLRTAPNLAEASFVEARVKPLALALALVAALVPPRVPTPDAPVELDHFSLWVSPGAPERAAFEKLGFRIAPAINRHEGQGTASCTIEFWNGARRDTRR